MPHHNDQQQQQRILPPAPPLPAYVRLPERLLPEDGHVQPDPFSYSTPVLIGWLLENFRGMSPAESAAVRVLAEHRLWLDRADFRHIAVTVIGFTHGAQDVPAPAYTADLGEHEFGRGGPFARIDFPEVLNALQDGRLEDERAAVVVLQFAAFLDGSGSILQSLDGMNLAICMRGMAHAGNTTPVLPIVLAQDSFSWSGHPSPTSAPTSAGPFRRAGGNAM